MKLRIEYMAQLRAAAGCTHQEVELPAGSSLAQLLVQLIASRADAKTHLLDSSGKIQASLLIVVNGAVQPTRDADSLILNDGDNVVLLPPIAGG